MNRPAQAKETEASACADVTGEGLYVALGDSATAEYVLLNCGATAPGNLGLNDVIAQEAAAHAGPVANPYPAFKAAGRAYMADSLNANAAVNAAIVDAYKAATPLCP